VITMQKRLTPSLRRLFGRNNRLAVSVFAAHRAAILAN